jgi:phosphate transport system substrate-binding protein
MKFQLLITLFLLSTSLQAQVEKVASNAGSDPVVIVTGARFSYKLVQKWIDDFNKVNPNVQIIIESRGSSDPSQYDVLAEVYEQDPAIKDTREYVYVGRYAILPVAFGKSEFSKTYTKKGLTTELIKLIYFNDVFADQEKASKIKDAYTGYTRLQKAGVPRVFAKYFGFEQKDIKGNAIAGSDEHLLKALLRDSIGISYLPTPLIYDPVTKRPVDGLSVLPVDLDGNGKVNDEERFYDDLPSVIQKLESTDPKDIKNVPVEYLHLSVDKKKASPEAVAFLKWVLEHGQSYLNEFGYLKPETSRPEKDSFNEFARGVN